MMEPDAIQPFHRDLGGGLTLRSIADANDVERLAAFNGHIHGPSVADMTRALILHHPVTRPEHWLFVEYENRVVSTLCLIPWEWRYEDVVIKSGEMGIVGTDEALRGRGLIRALDKRFKELLHAGGFVLSHIQGIPYFYRQFGYEYALPLETQWHIELRQITQDADPDLRFRLATVDDIPALTALYDTSARQQNISAVRSPDAWRYLLTHACGTAYEAETWLLEIGTQPVAYCRIFREGFGEGMIVADVTRVDLRTANGLLHWLKTTAIARQKPYIRFNLPANHDLLKVAHACGVRDTGGYQWQIQVVDAAALLRQIAPVLERRLAASPLAGISEVVTINLYRGGLEIHFEQGCITAIQALPRPERGAINIPPNLLAPLVLGFHSREALSAFYPDLICDRPSRLLFDTLFPPMQGFIETIY